MKKVLSLFDGYSGAQLALKRLGFSPTYYASEIDKYAMAVTKANFPNTHFIGDVTKVDGNQYKGIDLLVGGSPCQGFSFAGKQLNFDDPRSKLFFEYVRILKEAQPKYFLLENVVMKKESEKVISDLLGVKPIMINSNLVSAQNRKRLYWTNIPNVTQPIDKKIYWGDIRETGHQWDNMYYTDKALDWIGRHGERKGKQLDIWADSDKIQMIEASHGKKYSSQRFFGIIDRPAAIKGRDIKDRPATILGRKLNSKGVRVDYDKTVKNTQCLEVRNSRKINTITTVKKDNVCSPLPIGRYPNVFKELKEGEHYRYITPLECERAQTLPDNYTNHVSNSQRYKMIGNGFTVDVIAHILSFAL